MITLLLEAALRALLVALAVLAGLRLARMTNVPAQKAAWGLVLLSAIAMPLVMKWQLLPASMALRIPAAHWPASPRTAPPAPQPLAISNDAQPSTQIQFSEHSRLRIIPTPGLTPHTPYPTPHTPYPTPHTPPPTYPRIPEPAILAVFLYIAVAATLLLRLLWGLALAIRLWFTSEPFQIEPESTSESSPQSNPALRFSFAISSPVTIGSGILLPADCLNWDREKLQIVLAHERAHVRQGDFYLQLLAGLYTAVYWFSPLGWWLQRKLSDLGEAISDRAGLEQAASRASYAQVLLEFAALPRPTVPSPFLGVAMARTSNLSQRIERFLDESTFRRAFASSPRRILLAVLLVPVALFAGTALVRVQAAQAVPAPQTAPPPAPAAAPSPAPPAAPADASPVPSPDVDIAPPVPPAPSADAAPAQQPVPAPQPAPSADTPQDRLSAAELHEIKAKAEADAQEARDLARQHSGYASYSRNGDSYALVGESRDDISFSGEWDDQNRELIERARKQAHGKFIWFRHNGKSFIIDDPTVVARFEALQRPLKDLSIQQEKFAKEMEEMAKDKEHFAIKFDEPKITVPDISKQMAELNAAVAKLDAKKGGTVSLEQLADLQAKLGQIQARIGGLQGLTVMRDTDLAKIQADWGDKEGKLGKIEGDLGAKEGKISMDIDRQVKTIIEQALHDAKAKPVE